MFTGVLDAFCSHLRLIFIAQVKRERFSESDTLVRISISVSEVLSGYLLHLYSCINYGKLGQVVSELETS